MKMIMSTFSIKLDFNTRPHSLYQTYTTTFYVCRLIDQISSFSSTNWNQLEVKEFVQKNSSTRPASIFNDILRVNPDRKLIPVHFREFEFKVDFQYRKIFPCVHT